jgi:adenine-specific DNA-methyltransferase
MDFFVHTDLAGFLRRELHFFLKTQALSWADVEGDLTRRLAVLKASKGLAEDLIAFLAQLEEIQKRLFEKKRLVLGTDYIVPIRYVPTSFWPEILENEAQETEWRSQLGLEGKLNEDTLETHPTLPLYTANFGKDFKRRMLQELHKTLGNLDEATDGFLVQGENYGALRTLERSHVGKAKMIYLDPPYNTGSDEFLYKDNYRHGTWLSLMDERLRLGRIMLANDGVMLVSIDEHEVYNLRTLMNEILGEQNVIAELVWEKGRKNDAKLFSVGHEYMVVYARSLATLREAGVVWREPKPGAKEIWDEYTRLRKNHGENDEAIEEELRAWYQNLPKRHPSKALSRFKHVDKYGPWRDRDISWPGGGGPRYEVIHPVTKQPCKVPERGWGLATPEAMQEQIRSGLVVFREDHSEPPIRKAHLKPIPEELAEDGGQLNGGEEDDEAEVGMQVMPSVIRKQSQVAVKYLRNLMGAKVFNNPKDHEVLANLIRYITSSQDRDIILDYFAGSGTTAHAVISLNREDGGNRKFTLVEMGEHFDNVLVRRIQKVIYTPEWKDGKPKKEPDFDGMLKPPEWVEHSPRLVKVVRLESYEDALHNLSEEPTEREEAHSSMLSGRNRESEVLPKEDAYLLRYFANVLEDGNPAMLRPIQEDGQSRVAATWENPDHYEIAVPRIGGEEQAQVDWLETATLWLGLSPKRNEEVQRGNRTYRILHAARDDEQVAVVVRDSAGVDPQEERDFLEQHLPGYTVYINSPPTAAFESLESTLLASMHEGLK